MKTNTIEILEKAVSMAKSHSENLHNGTLLNGTYCIKRGINAELKSGYMVATNNTLLPKQTPFLGVWFNEIELSFKVKSLKVALEIAIKYEQTAIYDLKHNSEIYTKNFIEVSHFSEYRKTKLRKIEGFSCIRNNKAFFVSNIALYHALRV